MAATPAGQLRQAVALCGARALTNAAKWAAEQLLSLPAKERAPATTATGLASGQTYGTETDETLFARTLMAAGEFSRAADVVATATAEPLACFLHFYASYLASEKRKEDARGDFTDLDRAPTNPDLVRLRDQLAPFCHAANADPFLLYLYGVLLRKLAQFVEATNVLVRSVHAFPCNWSAWLELIHCCPGSDQVTPLIARLPDHFMCDFFRTQLYLDLHLWDSAATVLDGPLEEQFPQSPFTISQRAFCLYSKQRYDEADELYSELQAREPKRLEQVDVLSNILYVREHSERLSQLAHHTLSVDRFRPETCCVIGNYYSLKRMHDKSIEYFQRAVLLDSAFSAAWTLMGHEYLELKNAHAAISSYRRATDTNPHDYRAWYGIGQAYELLQQPIFALYYYRKASVLRPYDVRMWRALGLVYERLERNVDAIFCYEQAIDDDGGAFLSMGNLYAKMDHVAGAVRSFEQYAKIMENAEVSPDLAEACLYLANVFILQQDYTKAANYLARAQQAAGTKQATTARTLLRTIRANVPGEVLPDA